MKSSLSTTWNCQDGYVQTGGRQDEIAGGGNSNGAAPTNYQEPPAAGTRRSRGTRPNFKGTFLSFRGNRSDRKVISMPDPGSPEQSFHALRRAHHGGRLAKSNGWFLSGELIVCLQLCVCLCRWIRLFQWMVTGGWWLVVGGGRWWCGVVGSTWCVVSCVVCDAGVVV